MVALDCVSVGFRIHVLDVVIRRTADHFYDLSQLVHGTFTWENGIEKDHFGHHASY